MIVALVEVFAQRSKVPVEDLWSYLDRRSPPPPELRDAFVTAFFPLVPPDSFLPWPGENGTLRTMSATQIEPPRRGRPTEVDHPLFAGLAAEGVTLTEEARAVGRSPASIRSMCYPKGAKSWRPAPEALRQRWLKKYGVPLKVWR